MSKKLFVNIEQYATPIEPNHLVTLGMVRAMISRKIKDVCRVVLASNFEGTYSSADKTLTQDTPAELVVDGVTLAEGDRILLVGQDDATQNGIYVVTAQSDGTTAVVLTRADDCEDSADVVPNMIVPVQEGEQNSDTNWQLINDTTIVLDTTELRFAKFKGAASVNKFATTFEADGVETEFEITHGLNIERPIVSVYSHTSQEEVMFTVKIESSNVVVIKSDVVIEDGEKFDVIVLG